MMRKSLTGGGCYATYLTLITTAVAMALTIALPASALPPVEPDPLDLVQSGRPVTSIPVADGVRDFLPLDGEHVMLSTREKQYVLTLNRACVGLRFARHVGVTASDNTIWAGFDALTADGEACPIRTIHLVDEPSEPSTDAL